MGIEAIITGIIDAAAVVAISAFGASVLKDYFGKKKKPCVQEKPEEKLAPMPAPQPEPEPEPQPEPEEEPQLPAPVEHINAIEADEMLSDEVALAFVIEEDEDEPEEYDEDDDNEDDSVSVVAPVAVSKAEAGPKVEGKRGFINIGDIDEAFEPHDHITLDVLKHKGLVSKKIKRIKILADGELTKPLSVKAHSFSIQAIKMIELTGGTVIKIR